ncbi:cytochrome P450 [Aspergillus aurantiobrunneus]
MTRPGFAASLVKAEHHVQDMISQIPKDGSPVVVQPLFHNLTLQNSASIFWGQHAVDLLDAQQQSLAQQMNAAICKAFMYTQEVVFWGSRARFFQPLLREKAINLVYSFIKDNSKRAFNLNTSPSKAEHPPAETVAELFYDRFGAHDFDTAHIQIRQMFMAVAETTAETLTHLFHLLSRHPRVLDILRTEIISQLPEGAIPTASHLKSNLVYLNEQYSPGAADPTASSPYSSHPEQKYSFHTALYIVAKTSLEKTPMTLRRNGGSRQHN